MFLRQSIACTYHLVPFAAERAAHRIRDVCGVRVQQVVNHQIY